jgi:hypothetical protein
MAAGERWKNKETGGGPTRVKHKAVERSRTARVPLIWVLQSWPSGSCTWDPRPPPLRLKVERQGGSELLFIVVDSGVLI